MQLPGFVGPSNVLSSTLEDCELSVNLMPESAAPGRPKTDDWLPRRPGLRLIYTVGSSPVTCLFEINGRAFGASGTQFFEQFANESRAIWGTLATPTAVFPVVTMASNGSAGDQVAIASGGNLYIFTLSTNTLAIVADLDCPNGEIAMVEFFAGYFLICLVDSRTIQWSALEDGTDWDALDVYERSWASDNISFIQRLGTHIWVVGNRTSEVLYATGGIEVFAPAQESLIEHGAIAPFSGLRLPDGIACLDQDQRGVGQVVVFRGLQPDSISTYAINVEQQAQAGVLDEAVAFAVQMNGHIWYVLNNGEEDFRFTPVFDQTERVWHHWAHWNSTTCRWFPLRVSCHMTAFQKHYVGDRLYGAVYELSMANLSDQLVNV